MNQKQIGKFILKLRTEKNLSQYQLADMIPISRQAVSKWERGESIPDSSTLLRLSKIFDVTINELLEGKKLKTNSIKELEKTTLSILDESNNKTKKLKRNLIIYTLIITVLLLSFLSYYFINSYNQTKVYTISATGENFKIRDGIYLSTRGKNYLRIGNIEYDENIEIKNIKLYYIKKNKNIKIAEAQDLENFIITDFEGYYENITSNNLRYLINNSYIDITYNDNIKETIKLKFRRDFSNNKLFFKNQKHLKIKVSKVKKIEKKSPAVIAAVEMKKEEKPIIIKEDIQNIKGEMATTENASEVLVHDSTLINNLPVQTKENIILSKTDNKEEKEDSTEIEEEEFNIEKVIENIKLNGFLFDDSYMYASDDESVVILYYENTNQLASYINDEFAWDYYFNEDRYNCSLNYNGDCKEEIIKTLKEYLY